MAINLQNEEKQSTLGVAGDKLGTYYLTDNPKYYEIQRTNNFVFYVEGLTGTLDIPQNAYAAANADEVVRISTSKAFVPNFTQGAIQLKRGNNTMKFAGVPEFGSGTVDCNDFIGAGTVDVLVAWQQKAYNTRTEKVGLATDYKRDAYVLEYTPDYQLVRTWKICGAWPSAVTPGEFSHESADKRNVSMTIEYDKAFIDTSDIG